jgi:uncharacterized membrane protein YcaP (DUF421 family)
MMETVTAIFGEGTELSTTQMCSRAFVIFFVALALIRISGRRSFSMRSAFDNIITLLLGAVLSRVVYGASAFIPTVSACLLIVLLHRLFAWLSINDHMLGRVIKGEKILIYENGVVNQRNLHRSLMSEKDLFEAVRLKINTESLTDVDKIYCERNGEVSVLKKILTSGT